MKISNMKYIYKAAHDADDTVLLIGSHGIGKSESVINFANEYGFYCKTLFLSHQEVGDLIGIPRIIEKEGEFITTWAKPIWLQDIERESKKGKYCILFLDELSRAPLDVRQTALQLVLDRRLHEHLLPVVNDRRTLIIAADNPSDGDYQVDELDPALKDRFLLVEAEIDVDSWIEWARDNNINKIIIDFIIENPSRLNFSSKDSDATPRSWAKLSNYINNISNINSDILLSIIKGKVGLGVGVQFLNYLKNYKSMIKMKDVEFVISELIKKQLKVDDIGAKLSSFLKNIESIQKTELANQFIYKYVDNDGFILLSMLYGLEPEILASILKPMRQNNPEQYNKITEFDKKINNLELFRRLVSNLN